MGGLVVYETADKYPTVKLKSHVHVPKPPRNHPETTLAASLFLLAPLVPEEVD